MTVYQGTFALIVAEVIAKLRLDETDDETRAKAWVNLAYQDAVQQTGCLQQEATTSLTSGTSSYTLPAEVAWIRLLTLAYADGSISDPLQQVTLEEMLQQRRATVAAGQHVVKPIYALVGQNGLQLWPTPGAGITMHFWYVYLPAALSADGDSPVIFEPYGSKLLEYGALVEGARFKKDPLLPDYEAGYAYWMARFQTWLNRREGASAQTFRVRPGSHGVRVADRSADVG